MAQKYSVLFVCLGNICRSPLAEGVFRHLVVERSLDGHISIDSCGTGAWHVGEKPHHQSVRVAKKNGVSLDGMRARQVSEDDFKHFDLFVAMDRSNQDDLEGLNDRGTEVVLLRDYDPNPSSKDVPDPYYGGADGFDKVFDIVYRSCEVLLDEIEQRLKE